MFVRALRACCHCLATRHMAAVTFLRLTTGSSCHHQVLRLHQLERLRRPPQTAHHGNRKQINCGSQTRANCSTRHWHMTVIITHLPASRLMSHRCMRCGDAGGWVFCRALTSLCSRDSLCTSLSTVDKHLSLTLFLSHSLSLSLSLNARCRCLDCTDTCSNQRFFLLRLLCSECGRK